METIPKRRLLILITNQFAVLNLVHTGFLEKLSIRYEISIISDLIKNRELAMINRHFNCALKLVNVAVPSETGFLRLLRLIEKVLFFITFNTCTRRVKVLRLNPLFRLLLFCFQKIPSSALLAMLGGVRKLIVFISSRMFNITGDSPLHYHAVISSSPLEIRENIIVNSLIRKARIPAMGIVISWDNLTSKGLINSNFDHIMIWNEQMAREFEHLYSFCEARPRMFVSGIPRFDIYFENRKTRTSTKTVSKTILFATSAPRHFPGQYQIVKDLNEYIKSRRGHSLIIRCHPADDPEAYRHFAAENVEIWPSTKPHRSSSAFPALNFLEVLADTLLGCDVCVQVASTMRLDAAACNKPIISIAYDGDQKVSYAHSVKRLYGYSHQIPLNHLRLDYPVFSKIELFEYLDKLLAEDFDGADHTLAIQKFIHHTEAKSVDSMIQYVDEWLA